MGNVIGYVLLMILIGVTVYFSIDIVKTFIKIIKEKKERSKNGNTLENKKKENKE